MSDFRDALKQVVYDVVVDHPMWIGDDARPLDYLPEREARIGDFVDQSTDAVLGLLAERLGGDEVREAVAEALEHAHWCESNYTKGCNCKGRRQQEADAALAAVAECLGVSR